MDRGKILERTRRDLRSLLISAPRGVPVHLIPKDYKLTVGSLLPLRELGFSRLEDFLATIPDVVKVSMGAMGVPTAFAVANADTVGILSLVSRQKKPKLKKSGLPPSAAVIRPHAFVSRPRYGPRPHQSFSPRPQQPFLGGRGQPGRTQVSPRKYPPHPQQRNYLPPNARQPPRFQGNTNRTVGLNTGGRTVNLTLQSSLAVSVAGRSPRQPLLSPPPSQRPESGRVVTLLPERPSSMPPNLPPYAGTQPAKKDWEYEMGVAELCQMAESRKLMSPRKLTVVGYTQKFRRFTDKPPFSMRTLLCAANLNGKLTQTYPAVMMSFVASLWDVREMNPQLTFREGEHIKVFGTAISILNKSKGRVEPQLEVLYYERLSGATTFSGGQSRSLPLSSDSTKSAPTAPASSSRASSHSQASAPFNQPSGQLEREIFKLISGFENGLLGTRISKEYQKLFKRDPPLNLLELAGKMPFVTMEEIACKHCVLYLKKGSQSEHSQPSSAPSTPSPAPSTPSPLTPAQPNPLPTAAASEPRPSGFGTSSRLNVASSSDRRVVKGTSKSAPTTPAGHEREFQPGTQPPLPDTVKFEEGVSLFDVMVSYIHSPISFYLHLKENHETFSVVEQEINDHFSEYGGPVSVAIATNQLCACLWAGETREDDQWCRALITQVAGDKVSVLYPDYGNMAIINKKDLRHLPHHFYGLPFQAIHCSLHGMTEDSEESCTHFDSLAANRWCVANVVDTSGARVAIELIDGSEEGDDLTMNTKLQRFLHPLDTLAPKLPQPGSTRVPITLTDIDEDGVISIQIHGPGISLLEQLMNEINKAYTKRPKAAADFVSKVTEGSVYCAKYSDQQWYRVKVKRILPAKKVLVEYVDYGNEEELEKVKLRQALDSDLFSLPFQVIKCCLDGLPPEGGEWRDDAVGAVLEWFDREDLQIKVVDSGSASSLSRVKVFGGEDGSCLNTQLAACCHLFQEPQLETDTPSSETSGVEANDRRREESSEEEASSTRSSSLTEDVSSRSSSRAGEFPSCGSSQAGEIPSRDGSQTRDTPSLVVPVRDMHLTEDGGEEVRRSEEARRSDGASFPSFSSSSSLSNSTQATENSSDHDVTIKPHDVTNWPQDVTNGGPHGITNGSHDVAGRLSGETKALPRSPEAVDTMSNTSTRLLSPLSPPHLLSPHSPLESPSVASSPPHFAASVHSPRSSTRSPRDSSPLTPSQPTRHSLSPSDSSASFPAHSPSQSPPPPPSGAVKTPVVSDFAVEKLERKPLLITVSCVNSPGDFIVQLQDNVARLQTMMQQLNLSVATLPPVPIASITPNMVCAAHSSSYMCWYRSRVSRVDSAENKVMVDFLDYGGTEIVSASKIKPLPAASFDFPLQGIWCFLYGLRPSGNHKEWTEKATEKFRACVMNQPLFAFRIATVKHGSDGLESAGVALLDTTSGVTVKVGDKLIEAGFAENVHA